MTNLTKRAPDVWDSAAFSSIFLASSFPCSQALSTPAHTQVTQTVGLLRHEEYNAKALCKETQMEVNTIADFVLNALLTFLPGIAGKVAEGFLNDIGSDLLKLIKGKFQKDRDAKIALSYFLRSPHDNKSQELFKHHLRNYLETDTAFRSHLENLIIKPAVAIERNEQYPNPSRFLQHIISTIGEDLQEARIFDNFSVHKKDAYANENLLEFPELAQEFEKEREKASFVRRKKTEREISKENAEVSIISRLFNNKKISQYTYIVTYNKWSVFGKGEYHMRFALRTYSASGNWTGILLDDEFEKVRLSPDVIAKFLRALFAFYIRHMGFAQSLEFIKNLGSH